MKRMARLTWWMAVAFFLTAGKPAPSPRPGDHGPAGSPGSNRPVDTRSETQKKTDELIAGVRKARKLAGTTLGTFNFARGALLGISTTGLFGQKPTPFQLALANGSIAKANVEFAQLQEEMKGLKQRAEAYDAHLKELDKTGANALLWAEFTVIGVWKYKDEGTYAAFNLGKVIEVERAIQRVTELDAQLAALETKLVELRSKAP
jgi:hypothetical protein